MDVEEFLFKWLNSLEAKTKLNINAIPFMIE